MFTSMISIPFHQNGSKNNERLHQKYVTNGRTDLMSLSEILSQKMLRCLWKFNYHLSSSWPSTPSCIYSCSQNSSLHLCGENESCRTFRTGLLSVQSLDAHVCSRLLPAQVRRANTALVAHVVLDCSESCRFEGYSYAN